MPLKFFKKTLTGQEFLALGERQKKGEARIYSAARLKTNAGYLVDWAEKEPRKSVTIFDVDSTQR